MSLSEKRRAIRNLLNERDPADATAVYYAFHHPDNKTQIVTYPTGANPAEGFVIFSRTGMDLFRPLITLRLPSSDTAKMEMLTKTFPQETAVILQSPEHDTPILQAFFDFSTETIFQLMTLDQDRFEPIINVLVTRNLAPNNLPQFSIRRDQEIVASAGLNWQSNYFGDIAVHTRPNHRRQGWGRSVVAAIVQELLDNGRLPLYHVSPNNLASIQLAEYIGFTSTRTRKLITQATSRPIVR